MQKDSYFRFRMTSEEKRIIQAAADKLGWSTSDFARHQLLAAANAIFAYRLGMENELVKAYGVAASEIAERIRARAELYSPSPSPEIPEDPEDDDEY